MLKRLKLDTKLLREMDFSILIATILIVLFGILNIYAAMRPDNSDAKKQLIWFGVSLVVMYFIILIDYNILRNFVPILYWISILLLIYTKFMGATINGATGWIKIGSLFQIQASEVAKMALIFMLAKKMDEMELKVNNLKNFMILAAYTLLPVALIVIEPDMGMTMVCFFIVLGIFFCAGLDIRIIVGGLSSLVVGIMLLWNSGLIEAYQKRRLVSFLNPEADELGAGLQLMQSMTGIGSGGLFGTGLKLSQDAGTSYVGQFVPEKQTDFIFAVIGEHWGTIGAIVLLILYGILIYRTIKTARNSKDVFGSIICVGMASYFLFAILQNIGMTIGIMPITGITLPLVSYGGSSLLTTVMSISLIINIGMRKKKINF
ncbi:rod shape-determining protein RodA [Clostridium folliculivorans]|uniref:Peptidoglycan glycosyltransferase RodA n=1 Tax=Clostridium folliculivorans TaxID=2886038 RepID=A0A9W5XYI3_9CLOT|nr:rod shape-determining protein RodA [Clostridium folliculivorans]GKU23394.1 rod shape-determining protein RodA [Clostridium folliculivorans]GKU29511.1 rod shape-determining protein RodA [Clostridium folliculivorans]